MLSIQRIWKRIEQGLEIIHASEAITYFQPGATDEEIQSVESLLGITFPKQVRASYRIHNGSQGHALIGDPDQRTLVLCSLGEIVAEWNMLKKYADGWKEDFEKDAWLEGDGSPILVRVEGWNLRWIPILTNNGTHTCLDLAPTPHGKVGQIIKNDPEDGTQWLAWSWLDFLSTFADDLEAGQYKYEGGHLICER